ncbi:MAG: SURF1 family protein [Gemmatimonadaceae bacterium]
MRLPRHALFAVVLTLAGAGLFARLGVWQLRRLAERRAFNAHLEERLAASPRPVTTLPADSAAGHFHRVTASGVFDFDAQVVLTARSRSGSPGVHVLTPLRLANGATVMVNRGWVYSEDAKSIDLAKWREQEGDTVAITGYAETWWGRDTSTVPGAPRAVRSLDSAGVAARVGSAVLPYYVVQTSDSANTNTRPVRLGEPALDEGSHTSYAIQWFTFAMIAVIGGSLLVRQSLQETRDRA